MKHAWSPPQDQLSAGSVWWAMSAGAEAAALALPGLEELGEGSASPAFPRAKLLRERVEPVLPTRVSMMVMGA